MIIKFTCGRQLLKKAGVAYIFSRFFNVFRYLDVDTKMLDINKTRCSDICKDQSRFLNFPYSIHSRPQVLETLDSFFKQHNGSIMKCLQQSSSTLPACHFRVVRLHRHSFFTTNQLSLLFLIFIPTLFRSYSLLYFYILKAVCEFNYENIAQCEHPDRDRINFPVHS